MSNKLSLIFVALLAISFVHSLPRLTDITRGDPNAEHGVAKLMGFVEGLNASSIKAIFFDEEGNNGGPPASELVFGPEFDPTVFFTKLNSDIVQSYKRRCKKISGNDETYFRVKQATKELSECIENWHKQGDINAIKQSQSPVQVRAAFNRFCNNRHVTIGCMDRFMAVDAQCSFPSEIETDQSIFRLFTNTLDLVCRNGGNDVFALIFEQAPACTQDTELKLKTCANKATYAIVKRLLVKLIENETFEFRMDTEDCNQFDESRNCFVSSVENCAHRGPKDFVSSLFQIIRNETSCAGYPSLQTNLLN